MQFQVLVGCYDILRVKDTQGKFSEEVQKLLNAGWELRGELHSSVQITKRRGIERIHVCLVQDFTREVAIEPG